MFSFCFSAGQETATGAEAIPACVSLAVLKVEIAAPLKNKKKKGGITVHL